MSESYRKAFIYVGNKYAGLLRETDFGNSFSYDIDYLNCKTASCVSLTLPLQSEEFSSKTLFSFFDGLIPEGWLLNIVTSNWKVDQNDRFGLLLIACKDPVGNVSVSEVKV